MIGKNLKALRKRKKLSQEEFATELGLTRSSYSGYENGVAEPNLQTLVKFGAFYSISLDKLVKEDFDAYTDAKCVLFFIILLYSFPGHF